MIKIELNYKVKEKDVGNKVGVILRNKLKISNRLLKKLKMNEKIIVNNTPVFSNYILKKDDDIVVNIDFEEEDYILAENIPLDIIYEDEFLLAVNKQAGMVVHPSANHQGRNLSKWCKILSKQ